MAPIPQEGTFRFINPDLSVSAKERAFYANPAAKEVKELRLPLYDVRTSSQIHSGAHGLDAQGFAFVNHASSLTSEEVLAGTNAEDVYAQECIELVLKVTGASRGIVHNICFRRQLSEAEADLYSVKRAGAKVDEEIKRAPKDKILVNGRYEDTSEPARACHCDTTLDGLINTLKVARRDIRDMAQSVIAAEKSREEGAVVRVPRYAAFSVWRPLKPVKRDPIAVLDYRTIDPSELALTEFRLAGELAPDNEYISRGWLHVPPKHLENLKWYWMSEQKPDEVCIIKFADSKSVESDSVAKGCIHASPVIKGTEGEGARQSVECRVYAFWD